MSAFSSKRLRLLIICLLCVDFSYADNWLLYTELDGIRIEYMYVDCDLERGFGQQWVLLKFTNTSGSKKKAAWKSNLWYNGVCKTCNVSSGEYLRKVSIDPGKSLEGTCSIYGESSLNIFVKFTDEQYKSSNPQVLTKFELGNLNITIID